MGRLAEIPLIIQWLSGILVNCSFYGMVYIDFAVSAQLICCMFTFLRFQLDSIDFENNPELRKLQFLAPGPKMAGVTKGTLLPKQEINIKEGKKVKW